MTIIHLQTLIPAPIQTTFNLALNIDLHQTSMQHTNEKAIASTTSGQIQLNETVTWQATHFGIRQTLTIKITQLTAPTDFCDEMTKGAFKSMRHEHHFDPQPNNQTLMTDKFQYQVPYGVIGKIFNHLFLKKYMTRLLIQRNNVVKQEALKVSSTD